MTHPIIVSPAGYERLKDRLEQAVARYDAVRLEGKLAFELSGDGWHDNPELNRVQQREAEQTRMIAEIRRQIACTRIVEVCDGIRPVDEVRYGSVVRLASTCSGETQTWEIAGFGEYDAATRKLDYSSPLGRELLGKQEGDEVKMPNGQVWEVEELLPSRNEAAVASDRTSPEQVRGAIARARSS